MSERYTIEQLRTMLGTSSAPPFKKGGTERRRAGHGEHDLQVACLRWLRMVYPDVLCYAIPNGGQRNTIVAARLKAEGATAGVPDLHIPIPRGRYASLYIEMKNGKQGRVSEQQKSMIERLRAYGNKVVVCRTIEEFMKEIEAYFNDSALMIKTHIENTLKIAHRVL